MRFDRWNQFHDTLYSAKPKWMKFLKDWCDEKEIFIRELGLPFRKITKSTGQVHNQLLFFTDPSKHGQYPHIYLSVNGYEELETIKAPRSRERPVYESVVWKRLLWDLDKEKVISRGALPEYEMVGWRKVADMPRGKVKVECDLDLILKEALRLWQHYEGKPAVVFSGSKGFHVYLLLEEPITARSRDVRNYQKGISTRLGLSSADSTVWGDNARVVRIPYTLHPTTGLLTLPIDMRITEGLSDQFMNTQEILEQAEEVLTPESVRYKPYALDQKDVELAV